jgi:uncharacterized protein (TIGR00645 family)
MKKLIENILFGSRWLLTFFFLGLIAGLLCYALVYAKGIYHLVTEANELTREMIMLEVLELVDMVMIANLIKMIITGSYNSFVNKDHGHTGENISSGLLKIKMSTSLIGVSSIHLLQTFINIENTSWDGLNKQLWIHASFLIGALLLAVIEYLHEKGESLNQHTNEKITHINGPATTSSHASTHTNPVRRKENKWKKPQEQGKDTNVQSTKQHT